jgi:hypothetical protein
MQTFPRKVRRWEEEEEEVKSTGKQANATLIKQFGVFLVKAATHVHWPGWGGGGGGGGGTSV